MSNELSHNDDSFSGYLWQPVSQMEGALGSRVKRFLATTNWDALIQRACKEKNGLECKLLPELTSGWNHVIRILEFADQVRWVARLQMPSSYSDDHKPLIKWGKMKPEYTTIRLVQEKSKVPVPQVYVCEDDPENSVGVPFMFMDCLKGNVGIDLCWTIPPEHKLPIFTALAEAQVEMYNIELPQIGRIVGRNEDGTYQIGPAPGVGGPFDTAAEYFKAWSMYVKFGVTLDQLRAASDDFADEVEASMKAFKPLLGEKAECLSVNNTGPFRMHHGDFGHNNAVFDDQFRLLGVIDWESAFAAPCEIAAQFPLCLALIPPAMDAPWNYDENGCPSDVEITELLADREHYIAIVKRIEEEKGFTTGHRLSTALEDTQRQHITYAMRLYCYGKAGFYSKVLEGFAGDN